MNQIACPQGCPRRHSSRLALDLFGQSALLSKVTKELLEAANLVPEVKVYDGRVNFSTSFQIVLVRGPHVSSGW